MTDGSAFMGVILAAGKGTRMHPFSDHYPKPILPVGGKPLLLHQIEAMANLGIRDIVIVIGHLGHEVVRTFGTGQEYGVNLHYVEQRETLGIAHAVSKLEPHVDRPFFLFLGDIFFEFSATQDLGDMLDRFQRFPATAGVLAVKEEPDLELIKRNFIVLTDERDPDRVTRVIEKPRHPKTNLKGCGIYLFDVSFFDSVRRTPRTALRDEYEITDSIQIFLDDGYRVEAAPVIEADMNLSYARDLLELNLHLLDKNGNGSLISDSAFVHKDAKLERCVVMDGSRIDAAVTLQDCLVFPGVTVDQPLRLRRTILTPENEIPCDAKESP